MLQYHIQKRLFMASIQIYQQNNIFIRMVFFDLINVVVQAVAVKSMFQRFFKSVHGNVPCFDQDAFHSLKYDFRCLSGVRVNKAQLVTPICQNADGILNHISFPFQAKTVSFCYVMHRRRILTPFTRQLPVYFIENRNSFSD